MQIEVESSPEPGWYGQITGPQFALDDWCRLLERPYHPVAIRLETGETLFTSQELNDLTDADEVREAALAIVNRLNGAFRLFDEIRPVELQGTVQVTDDGKLHRTMCAEAGSIAYVGARVEAEVIGPDGKVKPQPPQISEPQVWNALAQSNELVSEMLDHLGRADNWYEIFKVIECCEDLVGDGERGLLALMGDRKAEVKKLKITANSFRHSSRRASPRHINLTDGKVLLATVARATLSEIAAKLA